MVSALILALLVVVSVSLFGVQVYRRFELVRRARGVLAIDRPCERVWRVVREVAFQSRVIAGRPVVGVAHALVFWGFMAFAAYTSLEFLDGLHVLRLTATPVFHYYALALVPFAVAVLVGITFLLVRRGVFRPEALGPFSGESIVIGLLIATLMITFLLTFRLTGVAASANMWVHLVLILGFLVLIPDSKHLHLMVSPLTVFLRSPVLGDVRPLDFEREEVGFEKLADIERKQVIDAFTCVECGRCQANCPAYGTGKRLNPKRLILDSEDALLEGRLDAPLTDVFGPDVLWQCTTCGSCERQCPVGVEHLPLVIGARRGLVSNGDAPESLGAVYNNLERRGNIWGLTSDQRQKFVAAAGVETFDAAKHEYLMWLGCAGSYDADFQKSLRSLFHVLRSRGVTFGVLAKERCTGDPAKRTGNEYMFQELAHANIEDFKAAGVKKILTACPHCLKTLSLDYRAFGFEAEVTHSAVLVSRLLGDVQLAGGGEVTLHDSCYLARYAGFTGEPRELLRRAGATILEPARRGGNTFCCGAGGGLLFEEHEEGTRISQERFDQLQATGAGTIITTCPFCGIMLKGAQASSNSATQVVDLVTFVDGRLESAAADAQPEGERAPSARPEP